LQLSIEKLQRFGLPQLFLTHDAAVFIDHDSEVIAKNSGKVCTACLVYFSAFSSF